MWSSLCMIPPAAMVLSAAVILALLVVAALAIYRFRRRADSDAPGRLSEEAQCAVILAVICEELRAAPADIRIKSIRRL